MGRQPTQPSNSQYSSRHHHQLDLVSFFPGKKVWLAGTFRMMINKDSFSILLSSTLDIYRQVGAGRKAGRYLGTYRPYLAQLKVVTPSSVCFFEWKNGTGARLDGIEHSRIHPSHVIHESVLNPVILYLLSTISFTPCLERTDLLRSTACCLPKS